MNIGNTMIKEVDGRKVKYDSVLSCWIFENDKEDSSFIEFGDGIFSEDMGFCTVAASGVISEIRARADGIEESEHDVFFDLEELKENYGESEAARLLKTVRERYLNLVDKEEGEKNIENVRVSQYDISIDILRSEAVSRLKEIKEDFKKRGIVYREE